MQMRHVRMVDWVLNSFLEILEDVSQLDDPLDYYVKHILWTQDHPNAKGANLTALLEQVTREFKVQVVSEFFNC